MPEQEMPKSPEPFMRQEFSGHLWNDWLGVAGELAYFIKPSKNRYYKDANQEKLKIAQGEFLYAVHEKIIARFQRDGGIPKINIESLKDADKKIKAIRYNQLVDQASLLYRQIQQMVEQLPLIQKGNEFPYYEIPDNHPILSLAADLKEIMIEVNELLYGKRCEFFD